jgi:hypothetical protein
MLEEYDLPHWNPPEGQTSYILSRESWKKSALKESFKEPLENLESKYDRARSSALLDRFALTEKPPSNVRTKSLKQKELATSPAGPSFSVPRALFPSSTERALNPNSEHRHGLIYQTLEFQHS